jgi:DNA-binding NarL/FixJ family response regulator
VRVVIANDSPLLREGVASLLRAEGIEVAAQASRPEELLAAVEEHGPDLAVIDIRMPPTQTDEGIQAALEIRRRHPGVGIVLLSHHVEVGVATRLLAEAPERLGYLLKERVTDAAGFAGSLRCVAGGGTALDPQIVSGLLAGPDASSPLQALSPREREVLELVAEGRSNAAIAQRLVITRRAVQKHVSAIFDKLELPAGEEDDRRTLAVLAYLRPELTVPGRVAGGTRAPPHRRSPPRASR